MISHSVVFIYAYLNKFSEPVETRCFASHRFASHRFAISSRSVYTKTPLIRQRRKTSRLKQKSD
ncbi:MAG TPA: hypothetical protein ENF37_03465 [Beggiatoa sp.]|nr:hypothetical protein [Beggiatoa sp.]